MEDAHGLRALQRQRVTLHAQHATLAQTGHIDVVVGGDELLDALFARFAGVSGRIGVEVVRVDLEGNGADGVERGGLDDGHVVGGADRGAGYVAAGAPADVGHAFGQPGTDGGREPLLLHLLDEGKGVAAAYDQGAGGTYGPGGVGLVVDGVYADTDLRQTVAYLLLVFVIGKRYGRIGNEKHLVDAVQKTGDVAERVLQIGFSRVGGVADKE